MSNTLHHGLPVIVNTGGPDIVGTIDAASYPNAAIAALKCVRVRFPSGGAAWLERAVVRPLVLADRVRVHGFRFADWQYQLWFTLIFWYARGFEGVAWSVLLDLWRAGTPVAVAAKVLAGRYGWASYGAPYPLPTYAVPYVADLRLDEQEDICSL